MLNSNLKRKRASPHSVHGLCLSIRILIALGNEKCVGIEHFLNVGNAFMHSVERINPFPTISHQRHDKLEFGMLPLNDINDNINKKYFDF